MSVIPEKLNRIRFPVTIILVGSNNLWLIRERKEGKNNTNMIRHCVFNNIIYLVTHLQAKPAW